MRSLSGIQPSGMLHLGNYFGALKQFVDLQDSYEGIYFVADYHSLTSQINPEMLRTKSMNIVMDYIAAGLDPKKSTIFLQSSIPLHTELMWILSNLTPMALLERGHAYKDKVAKGIKANVGLFNYPVLMAADILLYEPDFVPVGKDQKQHIEFTRDFAVKFNEFYGKEVFKLPEALILDNVATVIGTDGEKMSKSYGNTINIYAPEKIVKKQVMSIVTDSAGLEDSKNPDNNITKLYSLFADENEIKAMKEKFIAGNYGYGHAKKELLERILDYFKEQREKRFALENNLDYVKEVLRAGREAANKIAEAKMKEVRKTVGLISDEI
ncbi:tryptophan--tRNA ligase [Streptobacillus moniliformis]|uniref:Tryptophan--tRNA ligase n=1 Tax=Streptobacillus moniliformis (strain ATCC 14647 / DSM 12112 / NCTC 10651 / 9901) TaxID=519441 RepID=D1AX61_STRM9|nr:tryptophanyl-tRNA synthetase [Streptobacillus moniliformis DSM 12112]AVL42725.1 tryptophan--tRNA ligase [Streptobacillus moniliformis]SQA13975.1 Tryptophan--tRNA ligase [Streptobacillus moniliformis]